MKPLILAGSDPLDHVLPHRFGEKLFHWPVDFKAPLNLFHIEPHDSYFTNHILMTMIAAVIMLLMFPWLGRRYAALSAGRAEPTVPSGFTFAMDCALIFIRENVVRPVLGDKTDRFMPFLWTLFFYILICNLLGMIPLDAIIQILSGGGLKHIGGTATGNIMITAGLAICAFFMIHFSGARQVYEDLVAGTYGHHHHEGDEDHGENHSHGSALGHGSSHQGKSPAAAAVAAPFLYAWNFAPHVFAPEKTESIGSILLWIADVVMWAFLLVLEMIGAVIKPFALAIRLFANMVAGHVVLASILALIVALKGMAMQIGGGIPVALGCAALSCLELFVACLQAYIFTFLTTLFIGASVSPEH
ncbi:MAG: F0F1 ATP synthase subunit A [Phycisphaerales bacterium]|nr:F0F1 ATP synthase subunit A [Phycisphaerales bacterium]